MDHSEKHMIGTILDDEDDDGELNIPRKNSNIEQKNINFGNNLTTTTTKHNSIGSNMTSENLNQIRYQIENLQIRPPPYNARVYSPQLKAKNQIQYVGGLELHQVPVVQSAPGSALRMKKQLKNTLSPFTLYPKQIQNQIDGQDFLDDPHFLLNPPIQQQNLIKLPQSDPTHFYYYQQPPTYYPPQINNIDPIQEETQFLEGDLIVKCKDQQNARKVQKIFQNGDAEKKQAIFQKLEKGCLILSKDVFGNYVIQNLIEHGLLLQTKQLFKILNNIISSVVTLSFHNYGCRVVQKALEVFYQQRQMREFYQIFDQIKTKVKELVTDNNGNHVVQKIIMLMDNQVQEWIMEGVQKQVSRLVENSFGCRIIQKLITISKPEQITSVLDEIMSIAKHLCFSQFGNYIIQQLLQEASPQIKSEIQRIILENFQELSLNKFGSNVVDQAIKMSDNLFKRQIISLLLTPNTNGKEVLFLTLSIDAFGNYVVQNFFKQIDTTLQNELYSKLSNDAQLLKEIQQQQFGQYVYQNLVRANSQTQRSQ